MYLSNLSTFVNDLAADLDNISKLPTSQYYYWFTGLDINLWGARYNKDISYTNINTIYSTIKNIPQAYALMLLPTLSRSTSMNMTIQKSKILTKIAILKLLNSNNLKLNYPEKNWIIPLFLQNPSNCEFLIKCE